MSSTSLLIKNIGELVTMAPAVKKKQFVIRSDDDLGLIKNAWVLVEDGSISDVGSGSSMPSKVDQIVDAEGGLCMPGLIDAHTHPIFAGDRSHEFCAKIEGKSYEQIAAEGGGILSSVKSTRLASDEELMANLNHFAESSLRQGVTTFEAKTGYGLSASEELRQLRLLSKFQGKQHIVKTLLALHALPPEFKNVGEYILTLDDAFLKEASGLCDYIDAFVEIGYFLPADVERVLLKAKSYGIDIRLHCDEFKDSGAAAFAAKIGAHAADHLQMASEEGIRALADAGVVAVLLPGTSLYSGIAYTDARRFKDVAIAVATDYNPGSSYCDQLGLLVSLACRYNHLSPPQAIAAVGWVAARSLRLETRKGAVHPGWDADLAIFSHPHYRAWLGDFRYKPAKHVIIKGVTQKSPCVS
jgi:imidazolonepropionase